MITEFIEHTLAQVDDLAELKVSLIALHMLERKLAPAPYVTERELMAHPGIRDGLSFPAITLRPALQRAVARGTLLCVSFGDEARYFANDAAGRRTVDILLQANPAEPATPPDRPSPAVETLAALSREIERLEMLDAYVPAPDDLARVEEWLAQGYTLEEMVSAVRLALRTPRPQHHPPRRLSDCASALTAHPPARPSEYYAVIVAKTAPPPEEVVNLRERLGRPPNGREYELVRTAAGLFGLRAVLDGLRRISREGHVDIDALIPLLAEQEEAMLALQRANAQREVHLRELMALYESAFGLPPTSAIAEEMCAVWSEVNDPTLWRSAFQYAAAQNKRSWPYVKRILQHPSPEIFVPPPVNETAEWAFGEYKRRVNRLLDGSIAAEINQLATQVTDAARWRAAFDKAAAANALRWDYIKKVLTAPARSRSNKTNKNGKQAEPRRERNYRRPQVEYTEAEREAARERARQRIASRKAQAGEQ